MTRHKWLTSDLTQRTPVANAPGSPFHSPAAEVLPKATSNSLNSGTSMAAMVKAKEPPVTNSGMNGSVDSRKPGLPIRMLVTL